MDEKEWLGKRFEEHRAHLWEVAYRMLGSRAEADDAVQDAWLRLSRSDTNEVENLGGWLTTIVARVCLNVLRSRNVRREEALPPQLPDPVVTSPEDEAVLAESVSLALLVVLDTMSPAERLVFVLHDMFALPFEEIAPMVGRSPAATRQLASRARRRVKGAEIPDPDPDLARQRQVVDAFFQAARGGDFQALVAMLDPDVVLRTDTAILLRGATAVAKLTLAGKGVSQRAALRPALVNGVAGGIILVDGQPVVVAAFTIVEGKIVDIDMFADPERVRRITASILNDE
jgi:RNA polymerase sigma-70 factor (ECF subfamily)